MPAGNTYEAIATQTLGSSVATVTFSSIPSTYTDLVLVFAGTQTGAGVTYIAIQYNGDTGANYSYTALAGNGSAASSGRSSNNNEFYVTLGNPVTTTQNNMIMQVMNYSNTTTNKTTLVRSNNASERTEATVGLYRSTSAINSILVKIGANNFATGSVFSLYGIKAA